MSAADRVRPLTSPEVNARLDSAAERRLAELAGEPPERIVEHIGRLEAEWDFDRILEAEAAFTGLLGLTLAVTVDRRFLLLSGMAAAMMLLHATAGPYPLLPVFRRLGFRSTDEIDREIYAAKSIRGDFADLPASGVERAKAAWNAAGLP